MEEHSLAVNKGGRPRIGPKCTINLPDYLLEWAMAHPEGLSKLARRLLLEEYQHQQMLQMGGYTTDALPF